jgi:RNA polymerase sigma factor (sigma-70 family)
MHTVLHYLRRLTRAEAGDTGDARLLERYLADGDGSAFADLVSRHGPMVWGVCLRLLPTQQDAEDVFQATFLILLRKARSLHDPDRLGPWLHGVARRAALEARGLITRRRRQETPGLELDPPAQAEVEALEDREIRQVVDEEIDRLPEVYRRPLVLCQLQGLSCEEAARQLGCPRGTILSRLARGRERLRQALTRRGLELAPGAVSGLAVPASQLPTTLVADAVQRCLLVAAGTLPSSATVTSIVSGVLHSMLLGKLKVFLAASLILALLGSGLGLLAVGSGHDSAGQAVARESPPPGKEAPRKDEEKPAAKGGKATAEVISRSQELRQILASTINFSGIDDPKTTLIEAMDQLAKIHNVTFDVNEEAFKADGVNDILKTEITVMHPLPPLKTTLRNVLRKILSRAPSPSGTTFLIRQDTIEITTVAAVRAELGMEDDQRLLPLVWESFRNTSLLSALEALSDSSGFNVVVDPRQVVKIKDLEVTMKLANVPVDTAVRILADAGNLTVVPMDNTFYLTSSENATRLRKDLPARYQAEGPPFPPAPGKPGGM